MSTEAYEKRPTLSRPVGVLGELLGWTTSQVLFQYSENSTSNSKRRDFAPLPVDTTASEIVRQRAATRNVWRP
jgi:hypothetical protein